MTGKVTTASGISVGIRKNMREAEAQVVLGPRAWVLGADGGGLANPGRVYLAY